MNRVLNWSIILVVTTVSLVLLQCDSNGSDVFIVSEHGNSILASALGKFYYSNFNVIIDDSDRIFFHSKDSVMNCCDTGHDPNFPDYLALLPGDLLLYSDHDCTLLVDSISKLPQQAENSIQIAVLSDTIHSKRLFELVKVIKDRSVANYAIRLATEEEMEVLKAKLENRPYDFYMVNWNSRFSNVLVPTPILDSGRYH